jgi:NTE family protein
VAGTSAGAIVGALFAAGVPPAALRRIALETRWTDLLAFAVPHGGLISGEGLERFLEGVLPVRRFSDCRIPFAAVATDLASGARVDLVAGGLARAVRASCAIPVLFEPTTIGGRHLVDGGISSQVPVRAVRDSLGVPRVVAVDANANGMDRGARFENPAQVAVRIATLWAAERAREESPLADVLIRVDARGIPLQALGKGRELLERGRAAARALLPEIRALIGEP